MQTNPAGDLSSEPAAAQTRSPIADRPYLRTFLWISIVALLCCVMLWRLGRETLTRSDSLAQAIDALDSDKPSDRVTAIRQVSQVGMADVDRSIPPLLKALGDTDAGVRAEAAEAVSLLGSYAVYNHSQRTEPVGDDAASVGTMTSALLAVLANDDRPSVLRGGRRCCADAPPSQWGRRAPRSRRMRPHPLPPPRLLGGLPWITKKSSMHSSWHSVIRTKRFGRRLSRH